MRAVYALHPAVARITVAAVLISLACSAPAPPSKPAVPQPAPQVQQAAATSAAEPAGDRPRIAIGVTVGVSGTPGGPAPIATGRPPVQAVAVATQPPAPSPVAVAPAAPANTDEATLRFQSPLTSTAEIEIVANALKQLPGIVDVQASTESITVRYDSATLSPDGLRALLAATPWPLEP